MFKMTGYTLAETIVIAAEPKFAPVAMNNVTSPAVVVEGMIELPTEATEASDFAPTKPLHFKKPYEEGEIAYNATPTGTFEGVVGLMKMFAPCGGTRDTTEVVSSATFGASSSVTSNAPFVVVCAGFS